MLCCCVLRLEGLAGQWNLLTWTHTIKALQSSGAYQGAAELRAAMSGPVRPQVRCSSAEPWLGPGGVKALTMWLEARIRSGLELFAWFLPCAS